MCGPKFCTMRISHDVRTFAAAKGLQPENAWRSGMAENSAEFQQAGATVYLETDQRPT